VELADPAPAKKWRTQEACTHYFQEIGRYALENGNENAGKQFHSRFSDLKKSTVCNFKTAYKAHLGSQQNQICPQPVTEILDRPRGRPPILLELDEKLMTFLQAVRTKGGVVNIHVVRASAKALIESNPSMVSLQHFNMPRNWVTSLYRRMGFVKRAGTTTRPPVPHGFMMNAEEITCPTLKEKLNNGKFPLSSYLILIKLHPLMYQLANQDDILWNSQCHSTQYIKLSNMEDSMQDGPHVHTVHIHVLCEIKLQVRMTVITS